MESSGGNIGIEERLLQRSGSGDDNLKLRVWEESKKIWRVGFPNMLYRVCYIGCFLVTQSFIGHVNSVDLAGFALVQTLFIRFINGILLGMASATETLCGQAYGAQQYHMMGIFLQRSLLIDFATLTILIPVFLFAGSIFELLGQQPAISQSAGIIALWSIPFCYAFVFILAIQTYLQAQEKNAVVGYLALISLIVHIFLSWVFVYVLGWGVSGAMAALNISGWFLAIGECIYVVGGWCPNAWQGLSVAAFKDLAPMIKFSVSSGFLMCLELWYNTILVLIAGYMKDAEVAISAFSICLNINTWEFMIPLGLLGAVCVRVANELGRGDAKAVKFSIKVTLFTSSAIGVPLWILFLIFGNKIGPLFSDDEAVVTTISDLSSLLALSVLLNTLYPIFSGVAIGQGSQASVALINFICFYVLGLLPGILIGFFTNLQIKGIWMGILFGTLCDTLALSFVMSRTDWDKEVAKTAERLKKWYLHYSDEAKEGLY